MGLNDVPPFVLTFHCTVGVGFPLAAAVKVTVLPATIVWLAGFVVTAGTVAACTVNVAADEVALPHAFVKTASDW